MKRNIPYLYLLIIISLLTFSCDDESDPNLPPVEERVNEAVTNLKNELTAPENGWKVFYKPTAQSGTFYMILDFNENGEVTIQSDVVDNEGEFVDQTIPYRIDNALGIELIFETYGVFHYLFEQNSATFGAEFEWRYLGNQEGNLVFESISDVGDPSRIILIPAESNDDNLFALDLAENLSLFTEADAPTALIGNLPSQQLILENQNISVFWSLDPSTRFISVHMAAEGSSFDEVIAEDNFINLSMTTGYSLQADKLILSTPISFVFGGQQISIGEISFDELSQNGESLCPLETENNALVFSGQIAALGNIKLTASHLNSSGAVYLQPNVSSINIPFLFDEDDNSLIDEGILADRFPDASGFIFFNGVELLDETIPIYSLGLITADGELLLREYTIAAQASNFIRLNLTDDYYYSAGALSETDSLNLKDVTDDIFAGGDLYAYEFPQDGVFKLFNPCNSYEVFLVQ